MAAPAPSSSDPMKDLFFFLGIILGLMLIWYFMGGRSKSNTNSPFLKSPLDKQESVSEKENSNYKNKVSLSAPSDGQKSDPKREYVVIEAPSDNTDKVNITGWKLANRQGDTVTIGQGVDLPQPDQQNSFGNIYISPGEKIYVNTGPSPVGLSFRVNKCTGYFNQQLPFYPTLEKRCPNPANDESIPSYVSNSCIDYAKGLETCKSYFSFPSTVTSDCSRFISEKMSYQGCVDSYKNDSDFYSKEWRLFLNRDTEFWNDEVDTVKLKDSKGLLVDSLSL